MQFTSLFLLRFDIEVWRATVISSLWIFKEIRSGHCLYVYQNAPLSVLYLIYVLNLHIRQGWCKMYLWAFCPESSIKKAHDLHSVLQMATAFVNYIQQRYLRFLQYVHLRRLIVKIGTMYCRTEFHIICRSCHWITTNSSGQWSYCMLRYGKSDDNISPNSRLWHKLLPWKATKHFEMQKCKM